MNRKKSMRIFWISLCLLLVSGTAIIAVVQYRSHKKESENLYMEKETKKQVMRTGESGTDAQDSVPRSLVPRDTAKSYTRQEDSRSDVPAKPASGSAANYKFELRAQNGYLEVYYYHTENLFLHTGIPYSVLTVEQRQELTSGKYFLNEQDLYGYLESCTS